MMEKGYLCIVLHGHLPYVRHPEHERFLEEDWFFEAMTETYIPLIDMLEGLYRDSVPFALTLSLSPTLIAMMVDPLLQGRYDRHLGKLIELAHRETERTRFQPEFHRLAQMYLGKFEHARNVFHHYHRDLTRAFRVFRDSGNLELVTCAATHGYLPLMEMTPASVRAQVQVACKFFESIFGSRPAGIWLPECGFEPGVDTILRQEGIRFFFLDSHGILHGSPRPRYGVFAPVYCKGSGVAAFGRDLESSKQVWSAVEGYPGDFNYREFYRDIGFDLDYEYIRPYLHGDGIRVHTGIKYYRITGRTDDKQPYNPDWARDKAADQAGNFMFNREKQVEYLYDAMGGRPPIIVAPYDAELFGHWWYEGVQWIDFLMRKIAYDQKTVRAITPSQYLAKFPRCQVLTPSMSSWGWKGYSEVWLEGSNDWIYRHLHKASERMTELVRLFPDAQGLERRALNQALRELLLAQASDWAFIMKTGSHVSYAQKRTKDHLLRFTRLYRDLKHRRLDEGWLGHVEYLDNLFPQIDYHAHA